MVLLTWLILTVELTLLWNNVTGVNGLLSAGQTIPAIIGATSLLRTVNAIVMKHAEKVPCIAITIPG
jgi:hypothetical protein